MVLKVVNKWANGTKEVLTTNTDAQRGRYLFCARKIADGSQWPLKAIKNGYQYESTRQYTGKAGKCITTVTLERGWA